MQRFGASILKCLGRLPLPLLHGLSTCVCWLAYHVVRWRRPLMEKNLANAFPQKTAQQRTQIARRHVQALVDTTFESLKGGNIPVAELRRRVTLHDLDVLEALEGRPYFIVSAHQGNWEWQLLALSERLKVPVEAIYAPSPSAALEESLQHTRSRFGIRLIPRDNTVIELAKRLREPRAIAILSDQNPRRDAERLWLPFLNQDTAFPVGLDKLARLTKYPIVFQESRCLRRGYYEVNFRLMAEPPYDREGSELMRRYAELLQASIQANPHDWLWSYDRWRYPKPLYT